MDVRLGRLDVVVEVVTEGLDVRDDNGHALGCQVTRKENCGPSALTLQRVAEEWQAYQT